MGNTVYKQIADPSFTYSKIRPAFSNRTIVLLGDSITDRNKYSDGTTYQFVLGKGYFTYANNFLGCPWRVLNIASKVGDKVNQAAARMGSEVLPYAPDDCLVLIGINDVHTFTVSGGTEANSVFNNLKLNILEPLLNAGIRPIVCTLLPSNDVDTAAEQDGWFRYNDLIRRWCFSMGGRAKLVDLAATTYGDPSTGYGALTAYLDSGDDVHPNTNGASLIGKAIANSFPELRSAFVSRSFGVITGDPYNAATSTGKIFDTGAIAGTLSGTPTPTRTGTFAGVPTGWTLAGTCTNSTGTTITAETVASTDGGNDWLKIILAGSGMSGQTNCSWQLSGSALTLSGSPFSVGDWVELRAEAAIAAGHTNLIDLEAVILFSGSTYTAIYTPRSLNTAGYVATDDLSLTKAVGSYPVQIPTGATAIRAAFIAKFETAKASAGATISIRDAIIRKVDAPIGNAVSYDLA